MSTSTRPALRPRLEQLIRRSAWFMEVLDAARYVQAPDWWIGAGVIRDLVWDQIGGTFDPSRVKDVDMAFFDPADLTSQRDDDVEAALRRRLPTVQWDAKNQAAVHTWYERRFGFPVEPLKSSVDGVATWPETATCVAVQLDADGALRIAAPYGLTDLLNGICRRNPRRVSTEEYYRRLEAKQVAQRWPWVTVVG